MSLALERGVPQEERQNISLGGLVDWDAALIFLAVVRCGSFRSAAERVDMSINVVRSRLSYHPGNGRIPRIRRAISWLVEAFNSVKFPWFRDEFVHPSEFKAVYMGESLTHLFRGFSTGGR